jgi:CBS domain-containing protein
MTSDLLTRPSPRDFDQLPTVDYLDREVRSVMTPGVVAISDDASLRQAYRALTTHRIHAVLVMGATTGRPLGWVSARGLLAHVIRDDTMVSVRDAITQEPASVRPSATLRQALTALEQPGISQLLVSRVPGGPPEGVLSDLDIIALAGR